MSGSNISKKEVLSEIRKDEEIHTFKYKRLRFSRQVYLVRMHLLTMSPSVASPSVSITRAAFCPDTVEQVIVT